MLAGCISYGSRALFRHPSFWGEEADQLPVISVDPRLITDQQAVHQSLASQVTPFVASLDEATVNVGCFTTSDGPQNDEFRRLLADTLSEPRGYGWQARRAAYKRCDRLALGPERLVREADPEASERRVGRRLLVGRLEAWPPLGPRLGASSQFEAVSAALWGTPSYGDLLRQLVVAHMRAEPEEFAYFLGDDFEAYLTAMTRPGTPADELTLRALADRLGVPITVVTGDKYVWCVRYPPRRTLNAREVFLAAMAPASYAALRRQSALTSLRLSLSNGAGVKQAREARRRLTLECTAEGLGGLGAPSPRGL